MKRYLFSFAVALLLTTVALAAVSDAAFAQGGPPLQMDSCLYTGGNFDNADCTVIDDSTANFWAEWASESWPKMKGPQVAISHTQVVDQFTICADGEKEAWNDWNGQDVAVPVAVFDSCTLYTETLSGDCRTYEYAGNNDGFGDGSCNILHIEAEFNEMHQVSGGCDAGCELDIDWTIESYSCEPVTDVSLNLQDGYVDFSADVITVSAGVPLEFDLNYTPVDATEVVTEYVDAAGGTDGFVPGSPEGHWEAGWMVPGTYTLTYAVANCDGTSDLGDTSVPCYDGHQWDQATVNVISQCTPLEGIWLNSSWMETEPKGGEGQTEFHAEVGEVWEGEITYLPLDATRDSIQHPGYFDVAISVSGVPSDVTAHMNYSQYDELNFSLRPDITGTLYITYALANCSEWAGWDYEPYPGYQWLTATLHITDSVPITYLIPITQPTPPTMDCTYCLRPSEVCSEGTSICILTSWIDWQVCLQRCWFDFGLDWSIYVFQLFQWWSVELVNFHYAWLRYFWMSAMYQYEEIYTKWSAIQTLVSAYYHNYASFIQSLSVWINISSGNIISSFDEIAAFLAGKIAQMAPLISAWSTEVSDWINAVRDALSAWSSDTFDKLGGFLKNFVLFLRIIYLFIRMTTASGLEKLRIAWKLAKLSAQLMSNRLLGPFRSVIKSIRQMAELAGELGTGAKAAINSDTKADLFNYGTNFSDPGVQQIGGMEAMGAESEGGLSYALDGLEFFEDLAGASPLNYVSYIAIGILALRLTMWTLAKARDLMEDLRHF